MQDTSSFRLSMARFARTALAAAALGCALAGCATTSDLPPSEAGIIRPSDAFIIPPPGGPGIVSVVSTTFPNAIRQDISLATDARSVGENKISVIRFMGRGGDGSDAALKDIPFTQVNLTEEALAAWPGSGMAVSPYYVQNAYGPFGYAIAKPPNGDTCIYAWQRIEPTLKPSGATDRGTIIIRLQLCRRSASESALLEMMYKLRLNMAVFPPSKASPAIGAIAMPIKPVGAAGFAEVIPSAQPVVRPAAPARPAQPAPAPAPAPAPVAIPVPPPGAPIVPPPGGSSSGGPTIPRPTGANLVPSPGNGS